jgi:CO/xanthine dehydrogenase FAD-binding subunit
MWNQYFLPDHLNDALCLLEKYGPDARIIAGGTDLIPALTEGNVAGAEAIIDISRISDLRKINVSNGWIEIGACASLSSIIQSKEINQKVPLMVEAAQQVAGPQVRNMATLGGNVVNASPAADMVPPLLVLEAEVRIANQNGPVRSVPLERFLLGNRRVDLRMGDIVTAFRFAIPKTGTRCLFRKVQLRRAMAIAMLNSVVLARVENGFIQDIRIAMGAVAPTGVRLHCAEDILINKPVQIAQDQIVYSKVALDIAPISDFRASREYRLQVARDLLQEQVCTVLGLL